MWRKKCVAWLPGAVLGAMCGVLLCLLLTWQHIPLWFWYHAAGWGAIGALIGRAVWQQAPTVRDAWRSGRRLWVAGWIVFAIVVGGAMSLMAKFDAGPENPPGFLPDDPILTWLAGAVTGFLFAVIGLGEKYREQQTEPGP